MPYCSLEDLLMAISIARFGTSIITAAQTRTFCTDTHISAKNDIKVTGG